MTTSSQPDFSAYVGRTEQASGRIDTLPLEAMAALFDSRFEDISPDGTLPPLWHWLLLQRHACRSEIGEDGHPRRGGFMPPVELPRRMFAGSRTRFLHPLVVGDAVEREMKILSVMPKSGRSGKLVFVTVQHCITGPKGLSVVEEQDIVYRDAPPLTAGTVSPATIVRPQAELLTEWDVVETVDPDPVMLFRFSAATANSHRIHYDEAYATGVEGHKGLVVHGPLQAMLLADLCRRKWGGASLKTFSFKAVKPTYLGQPFYCCMSGTEIGAELQTIDFAGDTAMQASAT